MINLHNDKTLQNLNIFSKSQYSKWTKWRNSNKFPPYYEMLSTFIIVYTYICQLTSLVHICLTLPCERCELVKNREFYKSRDWFYQVYAFFSRVLKLCTALCVGGCTRSAAPGESIVELSAPWRLLISSWLSLSYQKSCLLATLSTRSSAWNFTEAYVKSSMNRIYHDD